MVMFRYGEWGFVVLSAVGVAPLAGDAVKSVGKIAKVVAKNIDNIPFVIDILKSTAKIHPEIAKALGKNDEIAAVIKNIKKAPGNNITKADAKLLDDIIGVVDDIRYAADYYKHMVEGTEK